jgi:hypothetical protein
MSGPGEADRGIPRRWSDVLDRCADVLAQQGLLDLDEAFDLDRFTERLALRRGRPIHLTPIWLPSFDKATVCGVCISTAQADHVFYADTLSALHRTHNAVHELAHLILEHRSVAPLARPTLGPSWVGSAESATSWLSAAGSSYSEQAEDEADAAAAVLLCRWQTRAPQRWVSSSIMRLGAERLADMFR